MGHQERLTRGADGDSYIMETSEAPRFIRSDGVVTRTVGGETVMVPIRSNAASLDSVYTLSEVATLVWDQIASPKTMGELVARVCETFEVTPEIASADVNEFLGSLVEAGLVKRQGGD